MLYKISINKNEPEGNIFYIMSWSIRILKAFNMDEQADQLKQELMDLMEERSTYEDIIAKIKEYGIEIEFAEDVDD